MRGLKQKTHSCSQAEAGGKPPNTLSDVFPSLCGGNKASKLTTLLCQVAHCTHIDTHMCTTNTGCVLKVRIDETISNWTFYLLSFVVIYCSIKNELLCPLGSKTGKSGRGCQLMSVTGLYKMRIALFNLAFKISLDYHKWLREIYLHLFQLSLRLQLEI